MLTRVLTQNVIQKSVVQKKFTIKKNRLVKIPKCGYKQVLKEKTNRLGRYVVNGLL